MNSISNSPDFPVVVFGEVLWDRFEDGREILGGAPFNVAWNLRGLGFHPLFVSRVGDDEPGARILSAMREWGLDPSGVEIDPERPTGRVTVSERDGSPSFRIEPDQAYDSVAGDATRAAQNAILYHGSLILRTAPAREARRRLRGGLDGPVFLDVNLRDPWWDRDVVHDCLDEAQRVKLNDDELARLTPEDTRAASWEEQARRLRDAHDLEAVIVTRGSEGAAILLRNETPRTIPAAPVENLVDTVGAGDAFASVCLAGLLEDWPPAVVLERANRFAARLCSVRGATIRDRSFYEREVESWQRSG
jgi:fructokinase